LSTEKAAIFCIDLCRNEDIAWAVAGETSEERWMDAQALRDEWSAETPLGEVQRLVIEIEWVNGVAFTMFQDLAHSSTEQAIEQTSLTAYIHHYLQYATHQRDDWDPGIVDEGTVEEEEEEDSEEGTSHVWRGPDVRDKETTAWAQHILDHCWLPEA
jgi:hypothetical protein